MVILGINSAFHESAAALIVDGRLVAAAEEERFNRVKHGKRATPGNADQLPWRAVEYCLSQSGVSFADVQAIGYSFDPWLRRAVQWHDGCSVSPEDFGTQEGEEAFFQSHLRARAYLTDQMPRADFYFLPHHMCHAGSAFWTSPYDQAAVLVLDGIGESASVLAAFGSGSEIRPAFTVEYPHSLGFLWEKISEFLGFDRYDGPGKVMALGSRGLTTGSSTGIDYLERFSTFVRTCPRGFEIDPNVLRYRDPGFEQLERRFGASAPLRAAGEQVAMAGALQAITENVVMHLARELWHCVNAQRAEPVDALCMAGGVALNCVANGRIPLHTPWRRIWIQPAAHDAGTALGAALIIWHKVYSRSERILCETAYLGPEYSDRDCEAALLRAGLPYRTVPDLPATVGRLLAQGKIAGWFQGRMEFGPRALGNRSILADPRLFDTRTKLNQKIKVREPFRPFAPTIPAADISRYLQLPTDVLPESLRGLEFMTMALPATPSAVYSLPAAVHFRDSDGAATARAQSLVPGLNPLYEELIARFQRETGVAAVLNTSLNISEPIVCTPADACRTFGESGLDALVLGSYIVERRT